MSTPPEISADSPASSLPRLWTLVDVLGTLPVRVRGARAIRHGIWRLAFQSRLDPIVFLVWVASDAVVDAPSETCLAFLLSLDGRAILAAYSRERGASIRWRLRVVLRRSAMMPAALATVVIPGERGSTRFRRPR